MNAGLLSTQTLMEHIVEVRSSTHRNRGFSVTWAADEGFYVKQHTPDEGLWESDSSVVNEARILGVLEDVAALRDSVPTLRYFDAVSQTLVTDWLSGMLPCRDLARSAAADPLPIARHLGRALARLHAGLAQVRASEEFDFSDQTPWVLRLRNLLPVVTADQSWGQAELVRIVQGERATMATLEQLERTWPKRRLIHGDMKWQNCLLPAEPLPATSACAFIDWEMAALGDPLWDLAGMAQSYLGDWMNDFSDEMSAPSGEAVQRAAAAFPRHRAALHELWSGYASIDRTASRSRLAALLAARLLQTLYEDLAGEPDMAAEHTIVLQLACNALADPERGAASLFEAS
jgi:aminoglycoside phosphotransferase (APT) family kinase protein